MLDTIHTIFVVIILMFYGIMNFCIFFNRERLCAKNSMDNHTEDNTWKSEER